MSDENVERMKYVVEVLTRLVNRSAGIKRDALLDEAKMVLFETNHEFIEPALSLAVQQQKFGQVEYRLSESQHEPYYAYAPIGVEIPMSELVKGH